MTPKEFRAAILNLSYKPSDLYDACNAQKGQAEPLLKAAQACGRGYGKEPRSAVESASDAVTTLLACKRLFNEALPKFNWGASALDANAIQLLNEVPRLVDAALVAQEQKSSAPASKWVSVEDRMPEIETPVLILLGGDVRVGERRIEEPGWEDNYKAYAYWDDPYDDGQCWEDLSVTHWCPISALPVQSKGAK